MKKKSIKSHLSPYSIVQKRKTTINHAFASAIAPVDEYVEANIDAALRLLRQDPNGDLICVYCGLRAETWDHLVGLVEKSEFRGYGHQLGNLVPCCGKCNSAKGSKDWHKHLQTVVSEPSAFEAKSTLIQSYLDRFAACVIPGRVAELCPEDWIRYCEIKDKIIDLMKEADRIAKGLREAAVSREA